MLRFCSALPCMCTPLFVFVFSMYVDAHEIGLQLYSDSLVVAIARLCYYHSNTPHCMLKLANQVILFHAQTVNSYPSPIQNIYFQTS